MQRLHVSRLTASPVIGTKTEKSKTFMRKRVLVNLEVDPDLPDYWAFVPEGVGSSLPKRPRQPPAIRSPRPEPLAFANPLSFGYGGGETPWPFDHVKALHDRRYRTGVQNAADAAWTASNWKYATHSLLSQVYRELRRRYRARMGYTSWQDLWNASFPQ